MADEKKEAFRIRQPHATNGKEIFLAGPDENLRVMVECDDVNRAIMAAGLKKILVILNDNWDKAEYAHLDWSPRPDWPDKDERWFDFGDTEYEKGQALLKEMGIKY